MTAGHAEQFPEGMEFLRVLSDMERKCATETDRLLPTLGEKGSKTASNVGRALSLLYRASCCYWGCANETSDHTAEYLVARGFNAAQAALLVLRAGLYDEALASVRQLADIASLVHLFAFDRAAMTRWEGLNPESRYNEFGFGQTRSRLGELNKSVPTEPRRYALLSQSAHGTSDFRPGAYTLELLRSKRGLVGGGLPQSLGILLVLNELGRAVAGLADAAAELLSIADSPKEQMKSAARDLREFLGGIQLYHSTPTDGRAPTEERCATCESFSEEFRRT
jgi:hypothetical protein